MGNCFSCTPSKISISTSFLFFLSQQPTLKVRYLSSANTSSTFDDDPHSKISCNRKLTIQKNLIVNCIQVKDSKMCIYFVLYLYFIYIVKRKALSAFQLFLLNVYNILFIYTEESKSLRALVKMLLNCICF